MSPLTELITKLTSQFGFAESTGHQILDEGTINEVWILLSISDEFVLRLNKDRPVEEALAEYALESACYQAVDSATAPRVQSVGEHGGRAFVFSDYVKGSKGQSLDAELAWRHLGKALRKVHTVKVDQALVASFAGDDPPQT